METGPSEHVEIRRIFIYLFQFIKAEFVHLDVASSLPPLSREPVASPTRINTLEMIFSSKLGSP